MEKLKIYCVTDKVLNNLENTNLILAGVGRDKFPSNYLICNTKDNIFFKEKYYSELTFHYWFWKNMLDKNENNWIGFCQYSWIRLKPIAGLSKILLRSTDSPDCLTLEILYM